MATTFFYGGGSLRSNSAPSWPVAAQQSTSVATMTAATTTMTTAFARGLDPSGSCTRPPYPSGGLGSLSVTALITGATSGLGRWLAQRLGERGWTVLVHGRDPAKVDETVAVVRARGGTATGFVADLADLAACTRLAVDVAARGDLTALVNNAAVGFGAPGAGRSLSADGFELRWAVNYLAPVALTRGLIDTLRAAAPSRIVNVGSVGQVPIDFDDLRMDRRYEGTVAYRRSKLALAAWSFMLADELKDSGVSVNCLHPATLMPTGMVIESEYPPVSTVDAGGAATLHLILEDVGSGHYFDGLRVARAHPDAYDSEVRSRLRAVTDAALNRR
jgi:NAD(P)-dependent dehydrogenase (short-subunit alcohol dehydrogenase family)